MVAYQQNELVSATVISKQFGEYISKVKNGLLNKIGILKNNKLNAVIISVEEYERMSLAVMQLEELELYQTVQTRLKTQKAEYLDGDDVLKNLGLSLDN
jgi:PHD/YefM family antitoxin component YafN of YafNO toxin-antitoxin module